MSTNRHIILNHVDTPVRILFWTKGEIALFGMPFFVGLILDQLLLGAVISCLNIFLSRQYKRRFGKGQFQAVKYWYLPPDRSLKTFPRSCNRDYVG